jgi:hypothetical protein
MKIKIMREGGFIGITSKANLEFDKLTEAEQNAFNSLANNSLQNDKKPDLKTSATNLNERSLGESAPHIAADNGLELAGTNPTRNDVNNMMRDGFSYSISMKKDGKMVSMKFDDGNAPSEIVEIFQKYVQY